MTLPAPPIILSETCSHCGQEVRYGERNGQRGWWHREAVDHNPLFGRPMSEVDWDEVERQRQMERVDENGVTYTMAEREAAKLKRRAVTAQDDDDVAEAMADIVIPEPEVRATPIDVGDVRLPGGAKQILNLARKHGWEALATYSRGPRVHSTQGHVLGISDYVLLRLRLDGDDRGAVASWEDGGFDYAYLLTTTSQPDRANSKALKAWIKGE